MTLVTKSARHDGKMLVDKEIYHKLNTGLTVLVVLISCLGAFTVIMISELFGPTIFLTPFSSKETVTSPSDGSPVDGASEVVYKQMGLINSAVKNAGYSSSVVTNSYGSYVFAGLPIASFTIGSTNDLIEQVVKDQNKTDEERMNESGSISGLPTPIRPPFA